LVGVLDDLAGFFVGGEAVAAFEDFGGVDGVEACGEEVDAAGLGLEGLGGGALEAGGEGGDFLRGEGGEVAGVAFAQAGVEAGDLVAPLAQASIGGLG